MSLKADFVCSICAKILKDPIWLPCICTVCGEHLHEELAQKTNIIKCAPCNIEHNVSNDKFKPNTIVAKILSQGIHLTDEENALKLKLQEQMAIIYKLCGELREKKSLFEVEVYDHFQEIRRHIDIRFEETNCIDEALYMDTIER